MKYVKLLVDNSTHTLSFQLEQASRKRSLHYPDSCQTKAIIYKSIYSHKRCFKWWPMISNSSPNNVCNPLINLQKIYFNAISKAFSIYTAIAQHANNEINLRDLGSHWINLLQTTGSHFFLRAFRIVFLTICEKLFPLNLWISFLF